MDLDIFDSWNLSHTYCLLEQTVLLGGESLLIVLMDTFTDAFSVFSLILVQVPASDLFPSGMLLRYGQYSTELFLCKSM